MSAFSAL